MRGYPVIVADDDALLRGLVTEWLTPEDYEVIGCGSAAQLRKLLVKTIPGILFLDVNLGRADGIQLCRDIRAQFMPNPFPIVLISGERMDRLDQAAGLDGGADDFLLKPIDPVILRAKVAAFQRRYAPTPQARQLLRHRISMEMDRRQVFVDGAEVRLTRKEFDLLSLFLKHPDELFHPKKILERIWGYEAPQERQHHTVEEHIYRLKKKLGSAFADNLMMVVGAGYRLR